MKKYFLALFLMLGLTFLVACGNETPEAEVYTPTEVEQEPEIVDEPEDEEENETEIVEEPEDDYQGDDYESEETEDDNHAEIYAPSSITYFTELLVFELGTGIDDAIAEFGTPTSDMSVEVLGTESRTLSWWTTGGWTTLPTSITVTFTDGIATSVMETADTSSVFTQEDADSINSGISEAEAYAILGAPYSITHIYMQFLGYSTTVQWIDAQFNSIMIMFSNGRATSVTRL